MEKKEAFTIVLKELIRCPMFRGYYDASNGNEQLMYGIATVMERIAHEAGGETFEDIFSDHFDSNMYISELKAKYEISE